MRLPLLLCGVFCMGAASAQTSLIYSADSLTALGGQVTVSNPTSSPIRIDSLGVVVGDSYGLWYISVEVGQDRREVVVYGEVGIEPRLIELDIPAGDSGKIRVEHFDPCPLCRGAADSLDVLLIYAGGASVPDSLILDTAGVVSVEDVPTLLSLKVAVAPNPAIRSTTVSVALEAPDHVRAILFDALGREVALVYDGLLVGNAASEIKTAGLSPGTYVVHATSASGASATTALTVAR